MGHLSKRERDLLEEIPKHTSVKEAAGVLGWKDAEAYVILHRLRRKLGAAIEYVKEVQAWRRRDQKLYRLLSVKDRGTET